MTERRQLGSALRQALETQGVSLSAAEARELSLLLLKLASKGLLVSPADLPCECPNAYNMGHSNSTDGDNK